MLTCNMPALGVGFCLGVSGAFLSQNWSVNVGPRGCGLMKGGRDSGIQVGYIEGGGFYWSISMYIVCLVESWVFGGTWGVVSLVVETGFGWDIHVAGF